MKINDLPAGSHNLLKNSSTVEDKKAEMAMEFERLFARQLVQEMTKDLFKSDDNKGMMTSGKEMYRTHIVDTLSQALAKQEKLGMSDMISNNWDRTTRDVVNKLKPNAE